ncbi:hypothetical protein O181_001944 [Austropuccinia psidii MF-1]|uniref:Uncharacterized protein n=1 Tax=Austropuccinia psidii MF-1 TaxID=1389203 RepID=A0A9Q3BBH9_9BASI|nr:hypothetical protein [Austropuccinia psidii MF-1]
MTITGKSGNIHKNADGLRRWVLANTHESPAWIPKEVNHIEGICVTDIDTEFLIQAKESYKVDKSCHILFQLLMKDCKDPSHLSKLDGIWEKHMMKEDSTSLMESSIIELNIHVLWL